jgi:general stress protein YciG
MADEEKDARRGEPEEGAARRGMTVSEAGRKGGIAVRDERGHAFYEEIGRKGGQKVRELIERGKSRAAREEPE